MLCFSAHLPFDWENVLLELIAGLSAVKYGFALVLLALLVTQHVLHHHVFSLSVLVSSCLVHIYVATALLIEILILLMMAVRASHILLALFKAFLVGLSVDLDALGQFLDVLVVRLVTILVCKFLLNIWRSL